jgi:hypothetical protein
MAHLQRGTDDLHEPEDAKGAQEIAPVVQGNPPVCL